MQTQSNRKLVVTAVAVMLLSPAFVGAVPIPFDVFALAHSSNSGTGLGLDTGIFFNAGEAFTVTVDPGDLWNAGDLPRWSNADGITGPDLFATGSDDSGEAAGTLIGSDISGFTPRGV